MKRTFSLINQNCRTAAGLISRRAGPELSPLERTGLALHLIGCRSCRRYRHQMRMVDQLVAAIAQADSMHSMPEAVRQRIAAHVERSV